MATLTVDNPQYPSGEGMEIMGIGLVDNGGPGVTVTPELEAAFEEVQGITLTDAATADENIEVA